MSCCFITGDTHGNSQLERLSTKNFPEGKNLTKDDYVIVTGDFGLLWQTNPQAIKTEQYWLKWLNEKSFSVCFVDGNHENHARLSELPIIDKFGGKVGQVSESIFHLKRGEIYTIADKTFFCFGGAKSRDRWNRKLNVTYWEEEVPSSQEMYYAIDNLEKHDNKVDYIITHTGPESLILEVGLSLDYLDPATKFLEFVKNNIQYEKWYCGHLHMDTLVGKHTVLWDKIIQIL